MAAPTIIPRSSWGGSGSRSGTIAPSQRRYYVVHYPVMGDRDERQWMRDIERMHINQGWGMIGYSYGIGQSGTIYEGCGLTTRPIHSPAHNSDAWGVVHLQPSTGAGVTTAPISDAMKRSSIALYDWLGTQAGRALQKWWHGRDYATACPGPDLRAWVSAGMPAPSAPPPQQPPAIEEVELITSVVADNGSLHVFTVGTGRKAVFYTWQRAGEPAWAGGAAGKGVAGMTRFAEAPGGRTIRGLSAEVAKNGSLHLFVALDDGSTVYTWQRKGATAWNGATQKQIASLTGFAPAP